MKHALTKTNLVVALALSLSAFVSTTAKTVAVASAWSDWQDVQEPEAYHILQYLDATETSNMVMIQTGTKGGLVKGTVLNVYRPSAAPGRIWVETGKLKIIEIQADIAIAEIVQQSSVMAKALFPKFPSVMAGDLAVAPRLNIVASQAITPTTTLSFQKLFIDPKATPATFELSPSGVEVLREAAKAFADARLSLLMVEGYTDSKGPSDANQVESYQRALTVRQYLVDELGFDEDRVVAVGLGEGEQVDISNAPGYVEANRRIVLKTVPVPH